MKQYVKNKPIKWGFKLCSHCANETGYLHQYDLYVGKKESTEESLGPTIILKITRSSKWSLYVLPFFHNFFNSPSLKVKLYERVLYGIDSARKDRR